MKKLKTAIRLLILLVVGAMIGLRLYGWNARNLTGNAVPMPFGVGASVVLSGSMEPTLSTGDLLIFCEKEAYEVGDVVVYQNGRTPVVHRIVAMTAQTVITQGDANNAADEAFASEQIKGQVIAAIPLVGYLIWWLKTPIGTLLAIAAVVLMMELSYRKERQEKQSEQEKIKEEIHKLMEELDEGKH